MSKPTLLDNYSEIAKIDKNNMLSFCIDAANHYRKAAKLAGMMKIAYPKPDSIIVAGIGGSAIGGELMKDWAWDKAKIPIDICREYHLPAYANNSTLVFCISYSGETEETLNMFLEALKRKCMIICISSGGTMHQFAKRLGVPNLLVPSGMAPRATLPYLFMPLLAVLGKMGIVGQVETDFSETFRILKQVSSENSPERLLKNNFSKSLALNVRGTVPVIYGFGVYRAVAQRFKTQFNENSKSPAKWESFPELDHNEIVGWEAPGEFAKCFSVILIRDSKEPDEIEERIEFTKEIVCQKKVRLFEIWSRGKSSMAKMASLVCTGDFTSVYLAILRSIDPTPVKTITLLKERLRQTGGKERTIRELKKIVNAC